MNRIPKKSLVALTFALSLFISVQPLMALALGDGKDREEIIIVTDIQVSDKSHNRAPALVPICAAYLPHTSTIELEFLYNIGNVQVSLCSLAGETQATFTVPSAAGTAIIPAPSIPGPYTLSLRTETGASYCGQFITY